jgi:hypothetical protein
VARPGIRIDLKQGPGLKGAKPGDLAVVRYGLFFAAPSIKN